MSQPQDNTVSQTTAHKTSQDASRYSDLPEAVPPADVTYAADGRPYTTGPQVVYDRTLPQVADKEREGLEHEGAPVPWWRRRRTLAIAAIVVVCVVVAVVVGGVVESKNSRVSSTDSTDDSNNSPSPTGTSSPAFGTPTAFNVEELGDTVCVDVQCTTLTSLASDAAGTIVMMFARDHDNVIWYRRIRNGGWDADWERLGGEYTSHAAAVSPDEGTIMMLAVKPNKSAVSLTYRDDGSGWSPETVLPGDECGSYVSAVAWGTNRVRANCAIGNYTFEVSYEDGRWVAHTWYHIVSKEPPTMSSPGSGYLSAAIVGDDEEKDKAHPGWSVMSLQVGTGTGSGYNGEWGPVDGNAAVLATSATHTDYFVIDANNTIMWVNSWDRARQEEEDDNDSKLRKRDDLWFDYMPNGYSDPVPVYGDFQSSPVAVYVPRIGRVEVFSVSRNGSVMHGARRNDEWLTLNEGAEFPEWESLGGYFCSAPYVWLNGTDQLVVFGLGPEGSLIHSSFTARGDEPLGEGVWYDDEGTFDDEWLANGVDRYGEGY